MSELDRLRRLLELVRAMRHAQNEHLKSRYAGMPAHNELKTAREAEKDVDALVRELDDAKVIAVSFPDGSAYTYEGSSNLRSNSEIEQACITHDPGLTDFHHTWIRAYTAQPDLENATLRDSTITLKATSQSRAGLGVWACTRDPVARKAITEAKPALTNLDTTAEALVSLIRSWKPSLPPTTLVTQPPQGASAPAAYYARVLAQAVAQALNLPHADLLTRNDAKRYHGPHYSRAQAPFTAALPEPRPPIVLVIDDLLTSGATMRLSIRAIEAQGPLAFGFAYSGC